MKTRSWDTVKPESKEGSDRSDTARERCDGGTRSEADDRRASQHGPRPISVEPAVQPTALPISSVPSCSAASPPEIQTTQMDVEPRPISVEPAVQPATLPEGWTVFLNASRQVLYGQRMLCFQVPENPEILNSLVFKRVPADGGRVDRKRKERGQPEPRKHKSKRHDHHQCSYQYMEKITSCSSVCWTDPFPVQNDQRRTTMVTTSVNSPSNDVIELKQVALWHGDRQRINRANEAAAEGIVRLLRWTRSLCRPVELQTLSQHSERETKSLNLPTVLFFVITVTHSAN